MQAIAGCWDKEIAVAGPAKQMFKASLRPSRIYSGLIRYDFQLWCAGCPLSSWLYYPECKCPSLNEVAEKFFVRPGIRREGNATGEENALQILHLLYSLSTVCVNACTPSLFVTKERMSALRHTVRHTVYKVCPESNEIDSRKFV